MSLPWYVLHVKPRTEKKVEAFCSAYGVMSYLPLAQHQRIVQRRHYTVELPVFPGYIFVRLSPEARLRILQTNQIVRVLAPTSSRDLVHSLRQISHALRVSPNLATTDAFYAGDKVRIVSGAFFGVEGVVRRVRDISMIILNIEFLGQALEIPIRAAELEKIGN